MFKLSVNVRVQTSRQSSARLCDQPDISFEDLKTTAIRCYVELEQINYVFQEKKPCFGKMGRTTLYS